MRVRPWGASEFQRRGADWALIGHGSRVAHVIIVVPPPTPSRPARKKCLCAIMKKGLRSPRGLSCRFLPFAPFHIHPSVRPSVRPRPASQREKREKRERETECEREEHKERRTSRFICQTPHLFRIQDYKFSFSPFSLSLRPSIRPGE